MSTMSKRTHFVTVTPLPAGISREVVIQTLHNHTEMIDLNPLVIERHPIKPPREAAPDEINCSWYSVTDKMNWLPGVYSGKLTFNACFNDLPDGMQSHIYAPMGLDMRGRWSVGGSLPGEPRQNVELGHGIPKQGLYLREDVDMKVNFTMTAFVKKTTKKTHNTLVERLVEKAHKKEGEAYNSALHEQLALREQVPPDYQTSTSGVNSPAPGQPTWYGDHKPPLDTNQRLSHNPSLHSTGSDPRVSTYTDAGASSNQRYSSYSSHHRDSTPAFPSPGLPGAPHPAYPAGAPAPLQPHHSGGAPYPQPGYFPHPAQGPPQQYPPAPYPNYPSYPGQHGIMEMPGQTVGNHGNSRPSGPNHLGANFSVELPSDNVIHAPVEKGEMTPAAAATDKPAR